MRGHGGLRLGQQVLGGVTDGAGRYVDLVVALQIHEHVLVAVGVQVLHRALVDGGGVHLGTGVERLVDDLAGQHVLQCGPHERPALARLDVLELHDGPQLAVKVEDQTVLQVVRGGHSRTRTAFPADGFRRRTRQVYRFTGGTPAVRGPATAVCHRACVKIGLIGAIALALGGLTAGALPVGKPFYLSPAVRHGFALPAAGMICAVAGLVLLVGAWWRLRSQVAGRPGAALRVLAVWTAPLLLAPPLFSRDVYSYLAQGALVGRGLDAYAVGPRALGTDPLVAQVHPLWLGTPAPYGNERARW